MKSLLLSPVMGKITADWVFYSLGKATSLRRTILNSKLWKRQQEIIPPSFARTFIPVQLLKGICREP